MKHVSLVSIAILEFFWHCPACSDMFREIRIWLLLFLLSRSLMVSSGSDPACLALAYRRREGRLSKSVRPFKLFGLHCILPRIWGWGVPKASPVWAISLIQNGKAWRVLASLVFLCFSLSLYIYTHIHTYGNYMAPKILLHRHCCNPFTRGVLDKRMVK